MKVSVIGLGCNNFGVRVSDADADRVIGTALDAGITLLDTADIYGNRGGSEVAIGAALGARRKHVVLATKFGLPMDETGQMQGGSKRYIVTALEESLRRLKTDWIDLYQYHWPDEKTPIAETLDALNNLVEQGKVRHIGCSNLSVAQLAEADKVAGAAGLRKFSSTQNQYSLLSRDIEAELLPAANNLGISLLPFFPLANGLLSGKYDLDQPPPQGTRLAFPDFASRTLTDRNIECVRRLQAFCRQRGRSLLELAFSWLVSKPIVSSVIAGATSPEQIIQNAGAAGWELSRQELDEIDRLLASAGTAGAKA